MTRKAFVPLAIGALLIVAFVYKANIPWAEAFRQIAAAPRLPVLLVLASNALTPLLKAWRWKILLGRAGRAIKFRTLISSVSAGFFLGLTTPGTSGEFGRVITLDVDKTAGLSSVLFEKVWDLLMLALIALTAVLSMTLGGARMIEAAVALWIAFFLAIYLLARRPEVASKIPRMIVRRYLSQERGDKVAAVWQSFVGLLRDPKMTAVSAFFSLLLWIIPGAQYYTILKILGVDASTKMVLVAFFIPYLASVLSLVPLGIGVFDLANSHLSRGMFALGHAESTASLLMYRMLITFVLVVWGFACYVHRIRKKERTAVRLRAAAGSE